ncbi:MAG: hypothetical protein ABIJ31_14030, partial [Pseudomonadota bacterium]
MIKKYISKLFIVFLLALILLPGVVYAKFEPKSMTIDGVSIGTIPLAVPSGSIDAVITSTDSDTTGYTITEYVYTWNNSITALADNELGIGLGDGSVPQSNAIVISVDADTQFGTSDGDSWYLHVKTVYNSIPIGGTELSSDTVFGPYTFDNVAPVATIGLDTSVGGQTATTASGSPVTLVVSGTLGDIFKVYVNSTETPATATEYDFSNPATSTLDYAIAGTGSKTVYAWFEDEVGNVSSAATSLSFTINAGKSMDPAGAMNLEVDATQAFVISGGGAETFNWSIVDSTTGLASTAASFAGAYTGVTTATITGVTEDGTVKVKAVSTADAAVYESGIITIVEKSQSF